ncbi:hypothetical protein L195_g057828, partial [Trifolium pratense]
GNSNGNGNIEASTRLNHKDVLVQTQNEHKHDLFVTIRKGGKGGGGGGIGGRGMGRGGGAAAGIIGGGVIGALSRSSVLASSGFSPLPIAVAGDRTVVLPTKFSVIHH